VCIRSNKPNDNGSYDLGYLMLNEGNLNNRYFMKTFGPLSTYKAKDDIELWLITCIRYFKYLYSRYECDGLYAYNAGERAYLSNNIPDITYIYKYRIKVYVSDILSNLYDIARENQRLRHIEETEEFRLRLKEFNAGLIGQHKFLFSGEVSGHILQSTIDAPHKVKINYDPRKRFINSLVLRRFVIQTLRNNTMVGNTLLRA
jgi:hypothetical protein